MRYARILVSAIVVLASQNATAQHPHTSELWGQSGELWDGPAGRLPDYSYAGYRRGEASIPDVAVTSNVKTDFGAKGNGVTDDTQAFKNAFANAPNGALFVPAGKYVISDVLRIKRSNFVVRGAGDGPGGTELYFTKSLNELKPAGALKWNQGKSGLISVGSAAADGDNTVLGTKFSNIVAKASRGDTTLLVGNTNGMVPGDTIYLKMFDDAAGSLNWYLNNDLWPGGTCSWDPAPFDWPVEIAAVSGNTVTLRQPLRFDVRTNWAPSLYRYNEYSEVGLERLKVTFPPHAYPGHHLEVGYNAIAFEGMLNSWVRDVTLQQFDNGIIFDFSKNCTMRDITLLKGVDDPNTKEFHHGFTFNRSTADCMLEDFSIADADGVHDVTVSGYASGNVIRRGTMQNGKLDHHQGAPFANLFSDLYMGASPTYIWTSGGGTCGSPSNAGFHHTYWNLRSGDPGWVSSSTGLSAPPAPPWKKLTTNLVPGPWNNKIAGQEWLEVVQDIQPAELFESQLALRVGFNAAVETIGPGCSLGMVTLGMTASDPVLGAVLNLAATGAPELGYATLFLGFPIATPIDFGEGCKLYLNPVDMLLIPAGTANAAGNWALGLPLPNDASLLGAKLATQVLFTIGFPPERAELSNGLKLTLGT